MSSDKRASKVARVSDAEEADFWQDPKKRGIIYQVLLLLLLVWLVFVLVDNTLTNMQARGLKSGFGFLLEPSGFSISQSLIDYSPLSSYFEVFLVGFINTVVLSFLGIIFATIIGFTIGVMRMSNNWLMAKIATIYVESIRNVPLLLQIFFWYYATLLPLPSPVDKYTAGDKVWFSVTNSGLQFPQIIPQDGLAYVIAIFFAGLALSIYLWRRSVGIQRMTGRQVRVWPWSLLLIFVAPIAAFFIFGSPVDYAPAVMERFRFTGGTIVVPEFMAMLGALSIYTASFIAEVVRGGLQAVSKGQIEASKSVGLTGGQTLKLVVVPQALRVIIPPLTNQYLNLTKNSSLAATIAYPELVSVFAGTALNQSGRVFEILAMTMLTYLCLSLGTASFMNWYNSRVRLVER